MRPFLPWKQGCFRASAIKPSKAPEKEGPATTLEVSIYVDSLELSIIKYTWSEKPDNCHPADEDREINPLSSLADRPFPKAALLGASLLILSTVAGVGTIQLKKHFAHIPLNASAIPAEQPAEVRNLRFVDQQDGLSIYGGHVRVFDAVTGAELPQLRERDGFVRAILNSLAYERTKNAVQAPAIFELARWSDNRITIADKMTGARINLGDFGPGNKSVFLRFFTVATPRPADKS
ncbi:MAG: photosynthetic complex assembly protein PuhC [Rhizomicrobium sp.]